MLAELITLASQPISDEVDDSTTFGTGIAKLPSPDENEVSLTFTDSDDTPSGNSSFGNSIA